MVTISPELSNQTSFFLESPENMCLISMAILDIITKAERRAQKFNKCIHLNSSICIELGDERETTDRVKILSENSSARRSLLDLRYQGWDTCSDVGLLQSTDEISSGCYILN